MHGFLEQLQKGHDAVTAVLPVCDDGGSTREILRVIGGPAIGDVRSAVVRLGDNGNDPVMRLLNARLSRDDPLRALAEWTALLHNYDPGDPTEEHPLWLGVSEEYRQLVATFLFNFNIGVLKATSTPTPVPRADGRAAGHIASEVPPPGGFDFRNGSVGNFFLTGARLFFGSLDASLFLLSKLSGLPPDTEVVTSCRVPGSSTLTVSAELANGDILHGQSSISHPPAAGRATVVNKKDTSSLPAPVARIFFEDDAGSSVRPQMHPRLDALLSRSRADQRGPAAVNLVVYGRGSLYTSLVPNLLVESMGKRLSELPVRKVIVTNGGPDRETRYHPVGGRGRSAPMVEMDCAEVVTEVARACVGYSGGRSAEEAARSLVTDIVLPSVGGLHLPDDFAQRFPWVRVHRVNAVMSGDFAKYDDAALIELLKTISQDSPPRHIP